MTKLQRTVFGYIKEMKLCLSVSVAPFIAAPAMAISGSFIPNFVLAMVGSIVLAPIGLTTLAIGCVFAVARTMILPFEVIASSIKDRRASSANEHDAYHQNDSHEMGLEETNSYEMNLERNHSEAPHFFYGFMFRTRKMGCNSAQEFECSEEFQRTQDTPRI